MRQLKTTSDYDVERGPALFFTCLEGKEKKEGHHKTEKPHSLGEGESQDGVGEQLLLETRVPGVADDERAEDGADSSTRPSHTNSGGTSSDELGCRVDVRLGCGGGEEAGGLDSGRPDAPESCQGEAGRDGDAGDGRHSQALL